VPQVAGGSPGVGATWVGIGGVNSRDLIQAGTEDDVSSSGRTSYSAWIETLPQPSQRVPLTVHPGDSVTVSLNEQSQGRWQISFKNNTTGQTYSRNVRYQSSHSSAEWVEEAPSSTGGVLPIDDFGTVSFGGASATRNGQTVNLSQSGAQPITLVGASGQALAVPSGVGGDGASFSVSRIRLAFGSRGQRSAVRGRSPGGAGASGGPGPWRPGPTPSPDP
jgi:Peptidase A4 family